MSQEHEHTSVDARLVALASRTAELEPHPGFTGRVMARLEQEPTGAVLQLRLPAWRLFPVSVLAAALALVWAVSANDAVNEALAVGYDDVELGW